LLLRNLSGEISEFESKKSQTMKQFKVISLYVGGVNGKVFTSGDIVKEKHFPPGNAELLVKQGFLEELAADLNSGDGETDAETNAALDNMIPGGVSETAPEATESPAGEAPGSDTGTPENLVNEIINQAAAPAPIKTIDQITKKELIAELKNLGVEFDQLQPKQSLYDLWVAQTSNLI
jgi:hypothetical protein